MAADWSRVRALFEAAIDLPPGEREAFLAAECGDDAALRSSVDELLVADASDVDGVIDKGLPEDLLQADLTEVVAGERIGAYRIQRVLGTGGMSTVFLAVQDNPRREVALKTMRAGAFSNETRRRFVYESEVLARLRHPGIAQIFEAGTWREPLAGQEVPFFALEYVAGAVPIDVYVREAKLSLDAALDLFAQVCDAVGYGHQLGVIHRDLKPANVLVGLDGVPKVIDFGIARATDLEGPERSLHTQTGHVLGTLRYMAPEQLDGVPAEVDTRVDVYALGVMFYEMLAGEPLLDPGTMTVTSFAQAVRDMKPPRPSRSAMGFELGGAAQDLDWIARKAIQFEKNERYGSVAEFVADIRRFRSDQPVSVGPPSTVYILRKFIRRNRVLVASLAAVFLALVAGVVATTWQMYRAEESAATARREAKRAQTINEFFNDLLKLADPVEGRYRSRADYTVREALDAASGLFVKLQDEPEAEAQARVSIGNAYKSLGRLAQAQAFLERAIALRRETVGAEHPDYADAILSLGATKNARGDQKAALADYRRAEEIFRRAYGRVHEKVGICVLNIGSTVARLGDQEGGKKRIEEAIEIFGALDPPGYRFIASCLPHLGAIAFRAKDYDEAERLYRESLAMFERADKAWHPFTAFVNTALGLLLSSVRKNPAAAEVHYRRALRVCAMAWGENSPQARNQHATLMKFYRDHGNAPFALYHEAQMLEIDGEAPRADAAAFGRKEVALAQRCKDAGLFPQAEDLLRRAAIALAAADAPGAERARAALIELYVAWGKPAAAAAATYRAAPHL